MQKSRKSLKPRSKPTTDPAWSPFINFNIGKVQGGYREKLPPKPKKLVSCNIKQPLNHQL